MTLELSKKDAEILGVDDMTGPQLRGRVLILEGKLCEAYDLLSRMVEITRAPYCIGCGMELDKGEQHTLACPWDEANNLVQEARTTTKHIARNVLYAKMVCVQGKTK